MFVKPHKIKLSESLKKKIRATYPLMVNHIRRKGLIAPLDEMITLFGEDAINLAIAENMFSKTMVVKRSKSHTHPDVRITVVRHNDYKNERPAWLDEG